MKKYSLFLLLIVLLISVKVSVAQEEVYEQPAQIIDTLETEEKVSKDTRSKEQKEDALTELEKKKEKLNRLRLGGNFGLQFGNYTYVNVSPTAGYMVVKDRLELGGGPILIYQRFRFSNISAISFFVYGADVYARGFLYKGLFLESRYDLVNKPSYYNLDRRLWVNHLLLGAGYAAPIGKIGVFNISLLYNVLDNDESIYQGTFSDKVPLIINMGFGFGIGGK
ncbi:MAG TPA: hypothetical protein PLX60_12055 [Chitinophagales bacterium]|jgi:hypothetical protein|nr:hypothetical protein [Chitinophagales bacterium]HPH87783.1 hypothetical protein [Chitinophagales bacterium]